MIDAIKMSLGTLAELKVGYPFRGAIEPGKDGAIPVVQMKDVSVAGTIDWNAVVRARLPGRRSPDCLAAGDVLFVARGNHFYCIALEAVPEKSVCGPHLCHLRVLTGAAVLPAFLAWHINQPPTQRLLRQAAEGTNQLSIRRAELEALPISVPSLAVQQQIVLLADAVARERTVLRELVRNRERQLGALAHDLAHAAETAATL